MAPVRESPAVEAAEGAGAGEASGAGGEGRDELPVTHEVVMKDHTKVSAALVFPATLRADGLSFADCLRSLCRPSRRASCLGLVRLRLQAVGLWRYERELQAVPHLRVSTGTSSESSSSVHPRLRLTSFVSAQVLDVQFSITGDSFLAATGSTQVKLYDRDGAEMCVSVPISSPLPS